jgi:hypothetical protein
MNRKYNEDEDALLVEEIQSFLPSGNALCEYPCRPCYDFAMHRHILGCRSSHSHTSPKPENIQIDPTP